MSELNTKILNAAKCSSVTEIIAKLITPITSIVLARFLTPEAFGVGGNPAKILCSIEEYIEKNKRYNLGTKGQSPSAKKEFLMALPEDKFIRK